MSASPPAKATAGSEAGGRAAAAEQARVGREPTTRKEAVAAFQRADTDVLSKPNKMAARPTPSAAAETAEKPAASKSAKVAAKPQPTKETREPAVQSVHFDPDTRIKTTIMTDGAVQEEPFEPRAGVGSR